MSGTKRTKRSEDDPLTNSFKLSGYFPYKARLFYTHVVGQISQVYETAYGMRAFEWRTMAILAENQPLTAAEVVEKSSMVKVTVSRAIARLRKRGWMIERTNRNDGRSKILRLSSAGWRVYEDLTPKMLDAERAVLSPLTPSETEELVRLMEKLRTGGNGSTGAAA